MIINCGFNRKVQGHVEHKNVTNIVIHNIPWGAKAMREELMKHKPEGEGWTITGYALVQQ